MDYFKYTLWPSIKVRLTYWWWVIKYRGKKNIPREVFFGALTKSVSQMQENMMQALRAIPPNLEEDEKKQFLEAIYNVHELKDEISDLK